MEIFRLTSFPYIGARQGKAWKQRPLRSFSVRRGEGQLLPLYANLQSLGTPTVYATGPGKNGAAKVNPAWAFVQKSSINCKEIVEISTKSGFFLYNKKSGPILKRPLRLIPFPSFAQLHWRSNWTLPRSLCLSDRGCHGCSSFFRESIAVLNTCDFNTYPRLTHGFISMDCFPNALRCEKSFERYFTWRQCWDLEERTP